MHLAKLLLKSFQHHQHKESFYTPINNQNIAPGTAFLLIKEVYNTMPAFCSFAPGAGGTVFTLSEDGWYIIDYETIIHGLNAQNQATWISIMTGPNAGALNIINESASGSNVEDTWVHGRYYINVSGAPVVFGVTPFGATGSIRNQLGFPGGWNIRVTIVKAI